MADHFSKHPNFVVREAPEGLTREVWEFYLDAYPPRLFVQSFIRQERMTKRHAWQTVAATNTGRYSALRTISPNDVEVPDAVLGVFLGRLAASVKVRGAE